MTDRLDRAIKKLDGLDLSSLDDFESSALVEEAEDDGRNEYIGKMWGKYGYAAPSKGAGAQRGEEIARALVTSLKMCQSLVDVFSTGGRRYRVTFDPGMSTAGTDLIGLKMVISPSPVYDETLAPQQVGVLLTALAVHEVSHDRYGRATRQAVLKVFGDKRAPIMLSNVLDDVRIERRFAAEYPGYRDVFKPMIDYVGRGDLERGAPEPDMSDLVNLMIAAVRYPAFSNWTEETAPERDWWQAWAERWGSEDSPRRHVEAIRLGLRRIVANQIKRKKKRDKDAAKRPPPLTADQRRIQDAISKLSPLERKAMRLTSEGKSGVEIAATLSVSMDVAKHLVRAGRKAMAGVS